MRRACRPVVCETSPMLQPFPEPFADRSRARFRARAGVPTRGLPQPKSAAEGIFVVAGAGMGRQRIQQLDVAAADHGVVGLKRGDEMPDDIENVMAPFLLAVTLEPMATHIVLIDAFLVRQVTEFHWLDDAVYDHRRSKAGSKADKEHLAALVAAQGLHGCVIDDLYRTAERCCEIEPDPSAAEIVRFGDRTAMQNRAWIADRHHVVAPIPRQLLHAGDHSPGGHLRPGWKRAPLAMSGGQDLDGGPAHVDHQHFPRRGAFRAVDSRRPSRTAPGGTLRLRVHRVSSLS